MAETRTLLLLRHAKAAAASAGMDDFDRPLAPRGRDAAQALAGVLAGMALPSPVVILCSAARRTQETLEQLRPGLPPSADLRIERALYLASPERLLGAIRAVPAAAGSVLVIGHNPGLHELALAVAGSGAAVDRERLASRFPTAALAGFAVAGVWRDLAENAGRLVVCRAPRDLD
ncbi:phosphohistidine phosphatase [Stella humosa]|uniref:Phosphohistidine phosphatase n=1 Tax=Stella humosa TaxID=94 RepID=A0A3N1M9M8_9PROT|nr:histidine phosphatase family protein [Stella humosa]ROP99499.1 phosphohistidine phosphatase [Stella humosa]BBK31287.1 phosphohistidine phosphatase [Stella humosa]